MSPTDGPTGNRESRRRARHRTPGRSRIERLSLEEGLSQSIVSCSLLDRMGFLWFGTEDGLNRYDGTTFRVFRHRWEDPESLSFSEIRCLLEDRAGGLWVGTFEGLNLFDPVTERCRRFVQRGTEADGPGDALVNALAQDPSGHLWIGTQRAGLDRLDPSTGTFRHFRHDPGDSSTLADDEVRALAIDGAGRVWVGTGRRGLDVLEPGASGFRHPRARDPDPNSLLGEAVTALHVDRQDRLWIGGRSGAALRDSDASSFRRVLDTDGHPVTAFCEDAAGRVWVTTDGAGLAVLDPEGTELARVRHDPRDPTSLGSDRLLSACRDGAGGLWFGTYGSGISKLDPRRERIEHVRSDPDDPNSLSHGIVWSLWEDRDGLLWVGTDGGLDRLDRATGTARHYLADPADPEALGHHAVRVVYQGPSGRFWVGTNGGLHLFDPESGIFRHFRHDPEDPGSLSHDEIRSLLEDPSGALWVGTLGGGLCRLAPGSDRFTVFRHREGDPTSLSSDFVRPLHRDRRGNLWVGTQGGGLHRFVAERGAFERYRHDPADPRSLSSDHVFAICEDDDGSLWLGTYAGGLDHFDPRTGHVERYGEDEGLPANLIYGVLRDDRGHLWISTNKGLSRFDPQSGRFHSFDWRDGLQSDEFNGGSFHRSASGELFFGGIDGFNAFFPEDLRESDFAPPVVLTDVQLANRSLEIGERVEGRIVLSRAPFAVGEIHLSHRERILTLQFASLDFSNPRKNRYRYRLLGFDHRWVSGDPSRRFATYTNLPPGRYRFEVQGSNVDGLWSPETASVGVRIDPPFWRTRWFQGAAATAALAAGWRSYRNRIRTIRLETEMRAARDAQRSIWPEADPSLPGFQIAGTSQPASEVGGDFFDYVRLDGEEESLCLAVGDVAGKGMQAAMSAVLSNGMLASRLQQGASLEETLCSLNHSLGQKIPRRLFTALCLVALRPGDPELRWANAGLPEPLLKTADGVRFLATADPRYPLGIRREEHYREERIELAAGQVLVLCTDGVPEALDTDHELYGYPRLCHRLEELETSRLTARQILETLIEDVQRFSRGTPAQDDRTMVVVKVL